MLEKPTMRDQDKTKDELIAELEAMRQQVVPETSATQRQQTEEVLRKSEERFRLLLENVKDFAIFTLDANGYVDSWNPGAERILGYQSAEIIGQHGSCIFTPEDRREGEDKKELRTAVTVGRAEDERWHVRADGTRFWASGIVTALRDSAGNLQGFSKIMRDFTEHKQLEDALRQRAEDLVEANRLKDEFLATVSHELRTPLNAMLGWARLLRTRKLNEATTARALETIERNAKSQVQLIEDLLDLSRIISGKLRLNVRTVELAPIIELTIDTVRPAVEAKNIRLESVLDPLVEPIRGDSDRLQQLVWNLLSNAIKFTPEGGRVQVRLERVGSHIQIRVSDTGKGINPDFLPYVFERFRQADATTTRTYGGLGLGLALVRQLVELHGGTVQAESKGEGQGATFTVKLPSMAGIDSKSSPASATDRMVAQSEGGVPTSCLPILDALRVLVVDDEADTRELLTTVLEQCGAEVTAVASVVEALNAIEQLKPDVLVSDIGMPGEDGYALIRKVRALEVERGGWIPAAALTAYARVEDRQQALEAGFQIHVVKPVEPAELVAVVANLAGRTG